MKPAGHLLTSTAAAGLTYAMTHSVELAIGTFCGGFWIDLDHYVDYVVLERQYSVSPFRFIQYYLKNKPRQLVLFLHSYELMGCLGLVAVLTQSLALLGYLLGASLHLALDIRYNHSLRDPVRFYSFWYRLRHGFEAIRLMRAATKPGAQAPWPSMPDSVSRVPSAILISPSSEPR